jgi:two-component sensor histidine kinase
MIFQESAARISDSIGFVTPLSDLGFESNARDKRHGLGLVRRLVEQVCGTAKVDFDRGTVWTIRFPLMVTA